MSCAALDGAIVGGADPDVTAGLVVGGEVERPQPPDHAPDHGDHRHRLASRVPFLGLDTQAKSPDWVNIACSHWANFRTRFDSPSHSFSPHCNKCPTWVFSMKPLGGSAELAELPEYQ